MEARSSAGDLRPVGSSGGTAARDVLARMLRRAAGNIACARLRYFSTFGMGEGSVVEASSAHANQARPRTVREARDRVRTTTRVKSNLVV